MRAPCTKAKPILFLLAFWLGVRWERTLEPSPFKTCLTVAMMFLAVLFLYWMVREYRKARAS
jgi:hypothetical protein